MKYLEIRVNNTDTYNRPTPLEPLGSPQSGLNGSLTIRLVLVASLLSLAGCSTSYFHKKADEQVYSIIDYKTKGTLGTTNAFTIDTDYSSREPEEIPPSELIDERAASSENRKINIPEALSRAIENNRSYQSRKERLYLSALALTGRRFDFEKQAFGRLNAGGDRESDKDLRLDSNGNQLGFSQLLTTGGTVSATLANDMVRYFTGDPRRSITTVASLNFMQPLLRGAGRAIVGENLTQAERNVIYEIREFGLFQQTFAVGIITQYVRLLQQQDQVRNAYRNYLRRKETSDEATFKVEQGVMQRFQADQALQQQLNAKSGYIRAVQQYQDRLDEFKKQLNIPLGVHLVLNPSIFQELKQVGLQLVEIDAVDAYHSAVENKLDILNAIDQFEDRKRKIKVAANALQADLKFVSDVSLQNDGADYTDFDPGDFKASAGLQLDLPFNRRSERNTYRTTLINFQSELRSLTITLDDARDAVREGLRSLQQLRRDYEIQKKALELALERTDDEIMQLLIETGKARIRDKLEAQDALLDAQNAVTRVVVDYFDARLKFLIDLGVLKMDQDRWWLRTDGAVPTENTGPVPGLEEDLLTPEQVFDGLANLN